MALVAEGDLSPTAQRIADRAGVSVRSVYQHFTDVEGLFLETAARTSAWLAEVAVDIDPTWPLERRVDAFVTERSSVLEGLTPFSRASRLIEPHSEALRQSRLEIEHKGRDELQRVFAPELTAMDPAERPSVLGVLDLLTTWSAWDHLRNSGAGIATARRVMRAGLLALLAPRA